MLESLTILCSIPEILLQAYTYSTNPDFKLCRLCYIISYVLSATITSVIVVLYSMSF